MRNETRSELDGRFSEAGRPPDGILSVWDLTDAARSHRLTTGIFEEAQVQVLSRALFRSKRHVLVVGDHGVGKTTLMCELARQSAQGLLPHLADKRFLVLDCRQVPDSDGRALLGALLRESVQAPSAIWCLDGLGSLLRERSRSSLALLTTFLNRAASGVIVMLTRDEYAELFSQDVELIQRFTRVEMREPDEELTAEIVRQHALRLADRYRLTLSPELVDRTVALASSFLLSERRPANSIRLLQQICEDLEFERTQLGIKHEEVRFDHIVQAIAERTGIPADTIAGEAVDGDFAAALREAVVGQETALGEVARELRLIKAGLNEPGKPASVMLFTGMTGVGKTELAKRVAELYSSSRKLQTYTMASFTEPHSVSGIIGVPPGYVGFENGGRLINELNADPYSVFLLDEAEKAHPNVWKPFLNLFDEGWIADQRGVRAHADRAIFILTTNAGDRNIAQMVRTNKPYEEIVNHVKQALARVRHERSSQPVFPPAFLARIGRVIVFSPLDEQAMVGIAERICRRTQRQWLQKRDKLLCISQELIAWIGHHGHQLNEQSGGREGGRIIQKLVADLIVSRIQEAATEQAEEYRVSASIHVTQDNTSASALNSELGDAKASPVRVRFSSATEATHVKTETN